MTEQPHEVGHGTLIDDGAGLARVTRCNVRQRPGRLKLELAIVVTRQEADKLGQNVRLKTYDARCYFFIESNLDDIVNGRVTLATEHFAAALSRIIILLFIVEMNTMIDLINRHNVVIWTGMKVLLLQGRGGNIV